MYDGIVYVIGSYFCIYVYEVKIGKKLWDYVYCFLEGIWLCCDVVNCGVVIYGDLVFFGMLDVGVVVFDWLMGKVKWKKCFEDYCVGYIMMGVFMIVKD